MPVPPWLVWNVWKQYLLQQSTLERRAACLVSTPDASGKFRVFLGGVHTCSCGAGPEAQPCEHVGELQKASATATREQDRPPTLPQGLHSSVPSLGAASSSERPALTPHASGAPAPQPLCSLGSSSSTWLTSACGSSRCSTRNWSDSSMIARSPSLGCGVRRGSWRREWKQRRSPLHRRREARVGQWRSGRSMPRMVRGPAIRGARSSPPLHMTTRPAGEPCPICYEAMTAEENEEGALDWCRLGCGKSVHRSCLRVWSDHQASISKPLSCPFCRCGWGERASEGRGGWRAAVGGGGCRRAQRAEDRPP